MDFVLDTTSSDEQYNAEFDYAFVAITPALARSILHRCRLFLVAKEEDGSLLEMYFWDSAPTWFEAPDDEWQDAHPDWLPQGYEAVRVVGFTLEGLETQNDDCTQMTIDSEGVSWTTIPKHASIHVTTERIPYAQIQEMVGAQNALGSFETGCFTHVGNELALVCDNTRHIHDAKIRLFERLQGKLQGADLWSAEPLSRVVARLQASTLILQHGQTLYDITIAERRRTIAEPYLVDTDTWIDFAAWLDREFWRWVETPRQER